ncbi:PREDICTED: uncharacterized protein LOC102017542 isoform X1 [Chinchilla lanigera]|uniref:uncharacterized protein LOC102017542 isoform X1 n=1 Tax=Chinchilla lanigera TaxID=34839 RepID=UPI0006990805|nr:PREDICTED: uncharacterized protein LOC102017542 isoform X1 [Chinchilla lanigera]
MFVWVWKCRCGLLHLSFGRGGRAVGPAPLSPLVQDWHAGSESCQDLWQPQLKQTEKNFWHSSFQGRRPWEGGQEGAWNMSKAGRWGKGIPIFLMKPARRGEASAQGHTASSGRAGLDSQMDRSSWGSAWPCRLEDDSHFAVPASEVLYQEHLPPRSPAPPWPDLHPWPLLHLPSVTMETQAMPRCPLGFGRAAHFPGFGGGGTGDGKRGREVQGSFG